MSKSEFAKPPLLVVEVWDDLNTYIHETQYVAYSYIDAAPSPLVALTSYDISNVSSLFSLQCQIHSLPGEYH